MKLQNKSFHRSWISSVQNREKNTTKNLSVKKYILKIIFLLLIILTSIIVLRWWQSVPNNEMLDIDKEPNINQPDALIKPIILFKNKSKSIITVKASKANRDITDSTIILLEKPEGHYKPSNEKDIYFYAAKGILDNNKQNLELIENVIIESSKGTKFYTNKLIYIVETNILSSNDNVTVDGSWGKLNGQGLIYNLEESTVILKGRPKLSLYNNKGNI